jgi:hypothetical protein
MKLQGVLERLNSLIEKNYQKGRETEKCPFVK